MRLALIESRLECGRERGWMSLLLLRQIGSEARVTHENWRSIY